EPGHPRGEEDGEDGEQPQVIEQVHARIGPGGQRQQLSAVQGLHSRTRAAAVLRAGPKELWSRNGALATRRPSGPSKSSTRSPKACGCSTWLRRRIGASPTTSMPS